MNKRVLRVIEIEALVPSALISPEERREPVSFDGGDYPLNPKTRRSGALCWFIDTVAAAMAGVYVGVWLDEPTSQATDQQGKTGRTALQNEQMPGKEQVPAEIGRGLREVS
jgi:hypothetical protein